MKINLKKSSISFQIKGQKEVTINEEVSTFFSSGNKEFVPFVCLYRKGDSIEWIK